MSKNFRLYKKLEQKYLEAKLRTLPLSCFLPMQNSKGFLNQMNFDRQEMKHMCYQPHWEAQA